MIKSTLLLLVLFIGLHETKKKSKHYLVETVDNHEDGTDYKIGDTRGGKGRRWPHQGGRWPPQGGRWPTPGGRWPTPGGRWPTPGGRWPWPTTSIIDPTWPPLPPGPSEDNNCECYNPRAGTDREYEGDPKITCETGWCYVKCDADCNDLDDAKGGGRCWSPRDACRPGPWSADITSRHKSARKH